MCVYVCTYQLTSVFLTSFTEGKGFDILIKMWKKYHLKSIKEMKVGNYIINIFHSFA